MSSMSRRTPKPSPSKAAPVTVTSQRKGVATWDATGVSPELAASGASWYYNWAATPSGITAPATQPLPLQLYPV